MTDNLNAVLNETGVPVAYAHDHKALVEKLSKMNPDPQLKTVFDLIKDDAAGDLNLVTAFETDHGTYHYVNVAKVSHYALMIEVDETVQVIGHDRQSRSKIENIIQCDGVFDDLLSLGGIKTIGSEMEQLFHELNGSGKDFVRTHCHDEGTGNEISLSLFNAKMINIRAKIGDSVKCVLIDPDRTASEMFNIDKAPHLPGLSQSNITAVALKAKRMLDDADEKNAIMVPIEDEINLKYELIVFRVRHDQPVAIIVAPCGNLVSYGKDRKALAHNVEKNLILEGVMDDMGSEPNKYLSIRQAASILDAIEDDDAPSNYSLMLEQDNKVRVVVFDPTDKTKKTQA